MRVLASIDAMELRELAADVAQLRASRRGFAAAHVDLLLDELEQLAMRCASYVDSEDFWESQVFLGA